MKVVGAVMKDMEMDYYYSWTQGEHKKDFGNIIKPFQALWKIYLLGLLHHFQTQYLCHPTIWLTTKKFWKRNKGSLKRGFLTVWRKYPLVMMIYKILNISFKPLNPFYFCFDVGRCSAGCSWFFFCCNKIWRIKVQ